MPSTRFGALWATPFCSVSSSFTAAVAPGDVKITVTPKADAGYKGVVEKTVDLGWGVINVAEELGAQTGLKVKVGNDANVAGLGEMWQGSARPAGSLPAVGTVPGPAGCAGAGRR